MKRSIKLLRKKVSLTLTLMTKLMKQFKLLKKKKKRNGWTTNPA